MAMQAGIRLSIEPLLTSSLYLADKDRQVKAAQDMLIGVPDEDIARPRLDEYHWRGIKKGKHNGFLTLDVADRIACALGTHPLLIWGEEYETKVWHDADDDGAAVA